MDTRWRKEGRPGVGGQFPLTQSHTGRKYGPGPCRRGRAGSTGLTAESSVRTPASAATPTHLPLAPDHHEPTPPLSWSTARLLHVDSYSTWHPVPAHVCLVSRVVPDARPPSASTPLTLGQRVSLVFTLNTSHTGLLTRAIFFWAVIFKIFWIKTFLISITCSLTFQKALRMSEDSPGGFSGLSVWLLAPTRVMISGWRHGRSCAETGRCSSLCSAPGSLPRLPSLSVKRKRISE